MILFAATLAGFATLSLEILGVHWLAPWFGTSALVWSNQIGVVLAAMALGAALGGRAARQGRLPLRWSARLLGSAGLLLGLGLLLLPRFSAWLLPDGLRLDEAGSLFLGGSLSAALLFFAPPVLLLAMVAPLLVEARAKERGAGRAAGEISAWGTVGSLAGVFSTTFFCLPVLGLRWTLILVAAVLCLAALLLDRGARKVAVGGWLFLILPTLGPDVAARANLPDAAPGSCSVLAVRDTPYQHLRVLSFRDAEGRETERWLQMNEGVDSYQSRWSARGDWPGGYYDLFALAPIYALSGRPAGDPVDFWLLGGGSGAALAPIAAALGRRRWQATGVELDPEVSRLAAAFLPLPEPLSSRFRVVHGDARSLLHAAPELLDFLILDAYSSQFELPPQLTTAEFFAEARAHLRPGGVLAVNLGSGRRVEGGDGVLGPLLAGIRASFGSRMRLHQVPFSRNVVVFARRDEDLLPLSALADWLPPDSPLTLGAACLPGEVQEAPAVPGAIPFTDDRNPVTLRQTRAWLRSL